MEATIAAPDASRDSKLGAQPSTGHACFSRPPLPALVFFFSSPSLPPPSQPQNNFPLYKQNSLVRKQYHFRSKDKRDINLVDGKFSFTV